MIKRTLSFSNPTRLNMRNGQLVIRRKVDETEQENTVPIEDVGVMILDHEQINISHGAIAALLENNVALITSNRSHMPVGLLLPLDGHSLQNERFRAQLDASEPLKKQIWQQTIQTKIRNQAALLQLSGKDQDSNKLKAWANEVKSGDTENHEARAAAWYWPRIFDVVPGFNRGRTGEAPNAWLNYGYAILRAVIARNLVGSGMLPTMGVHHANKYNAYCLADDIMEPYRPYVDRVVLSMLEKHELSNEINSEMKQDLLKIPAIDVVIDKEKSPLLVAAQRTTASLARVFQGETRKVLYPEL